jgi:MFS family permease
MFVGALGFFVAPLLYAESRGMPLLLLGRVVQGLGLGIFTTAFQALATELAPQDKRGEGLGLAGASTSLAFVAAPLAGDWLAANWGYTPLFQVSAAAGAASVLMVVLIAAFRERTLRPVTHSSSASSAQASRQPGSPGAGEQALSGEAGLRAALAQTGVQAGVLAMAALGIPFGALITFLPLFADERQIQGVGIVFSVYAAVIMLAQPMAGWLADRIGRRRVILPGLAITALATVVLSLDGSVWVFILAGAVYGIGGGLARGGIDPLVQDSVPRALRGTAAAVQYTSFDFWIGVGSYPIGVLANAIGYATTFVMTGVACGLGGGALWALLRRTRSRF